MTSTILVLVTALLAGPPEVASDDDGTKAEKASVQAEGSAPKSGDVPAPGMMIFVDPDTGELTADPAPGQVQRLLELGRQAARERQQAGEPPREMPTFVTPVGLGAALDERFAHPLVVRRAADGSFRFLCGSDHSHDSEPADPPPSSEPEPRR